MCRLLGQLVGLALLAALLHAALLGPAAFDELASPRPRVPRQLHQRLAHRGHAALGGLDLALLLFHGLVQPLHEGLVAVDDFDCTPAAELRLQRCRYSPR
jgi:hypothetical protein